MSTDGDPSSSAKELRALKTSDGSTLLFNCHISGFGGQPILYPSSAAGLPDPFAEQLFAMSSPMPEAMIATAVKEGLAADQGSTGFAYQADAAHLIKFLNIGTRSTSSSLVVIDDA